MDEIVAQVHFDGSTDQYPEFLLSIKNRFDAITAKHKTLFSTDSNGLFEAYLSNLPEESRQHYTCHAWREFIEKAGTLVVILEDGSVESPVWGENAPPFFAASVKAMREIVLNARVTGVFLSEKPVLGRPITGKWEHISIKLPDELVLRSQLFNANQAMAAKTEELNTLQNGLREYSLNTVEQAVTLLKTESLYRSEKCLGVAEWLRDLHNRLAAIQNKRRRENILWLAAATSPPGYCHIKSTMIGTLLDDIAAGLPFDDVSARFAAKMHPLQYQRPQAPPAAGNIEQAEKIIEKMGLQKSLVRRFARLDELETIWLPKKKDPVKGSGVFSHLLPKNKVNETHLTIPVTAMTWRKFSETILPMAESIEYLAENKKANYGAILTAFYEDAPPILQWDSVEKRNPFSQYVYHGGTNITDWNLQPGYIKVTGVCYQPSMWYGGKYPHQSQSVFFILDGARDRQKNNQSNGNALFPENLISELREIRSTIEAYSRKEAVKGYETASACGIKLEYGSTWNAVFRITTNTGTASYKLDRWD